MGGLVSLASTWISNMLICSCHIGGCFFLTMRPMTVWLYELLDASMSCGDKKDGSGRLEQILPPQECGDFSETVWTDLSHTLHPASDLYLPIRYLMPWLNGTPGMTAQSGIYVGNLSIADGLWNQWKKGTSSPNKAKSMPMQRGTSKSA